MRLPYDFTAVSEDELTGIWADTLQSAADPREKTVLLATLMDKYWWNRKTGEALFIYYMNPKLGAPNDPDYTEEDYLNSEIATLEGYDILEKNVSKVTLGGKEYMKADLEIDFDYEVGHVYLYVRKLDNDLMLLIEAASFSEKTADFYEDLFM